MPNRLPPFPPDRVREARRRHRLGASQQEIAEVLGTSQGTAGRRIRDWGWGPSKMRGARPHRPAFRFVVEGEGEGAESGPEPEERPATAAELAARMRRQIGREMRRIELCGGEGIEIARTLASLAQVLKALSAIPGAEEPPPEEIDVDAFRNEIARRLEALLAEDDAHFPAEEGAPSPESHIHPG